LLAEIQALFPGLGQNTAISPRREQIREVKKIAVLRANNLGDFIFALPALTALRQAFPQSEIVLLGRQWHADFLTGRPGPVDRVIVVPPIQGIYGQLEYQLTPGETDQFFESMEREHFDLAIQVHGDGRYSNPFVKRLGARFTVGTKMPEALPLDLWVPYTYTQSEILRQLEVVSLVGANTTKLEPQLYVTEEDLEEATAYLDVTGKPLVVLHPGSTDPRQRWPMEKFAAIGDALSFAGARVMIIGNEDESNLVESVVDRMTGEAETLVGKLTLRGMTGFLSQARLVIANNTDYLHLAWAVGAATVGIYWFGSLLASGPLNRIRHRPAVSWRVTCPVCGLDCTRFSCDHTNTWLDDITVTEVFSSALELINNV
jgi:ADP-heptose:LPS heptosyltransferase